MKLKVINFISSLFKKEKKMKDEIVMNNIENNEYDEIIKKEGETYVVDEIGDDEKYVFLTRESDGESFQEFDITDELYNEMLNNHNEILKLKYEDGAYKIVEN